MLRFTSSTILRS